MELAGLPTAEARTFRESPSRAHSPGLGTGAKRRSSAAPEIVSPRVGGGPNLPYSVRPPRSPGQPPPSPPAAPKVQRWDPSHQVEVALVRPCRIGETQRSGKGPIAPAKFRSKSGSLAKAWPMLRRSPSGRTITVPSCCNGPGNIKQTKEGPEALRSEQDSVPSRLKLESCENSLGETAAIFGA
ncbi:MAG: hypothetical protein KatS3mg106_122 [Gemmataceae bacterium]|nr:MAG: hypothetical protein KatS3mg106_122 [Gemmataceae bacterium]